MNKLSRLIVALVAGLMAVALTAVAVAPATATPSKPAIEVFLADGVTPVRTTQLHPGDQVVVKGSGFDPNANTDGLPVPVPPGVPHGTFVTFGPFEPNCSQASQNAPAQCSISTSVLPGSAQAEVALSPGPHWRDRHTSSGRTIFCSPAHGSSSQRTVTTRCGTQSNPSCTLSAPGGPRRGSWWPLPRMPMFIGKSDSIQDVMEFVEGTVTHLVRFGAFVELEPGIEGLVFGEYLLRNNPEMAIALVTGAADERVARLMLAVSTLVLGIVALAWPDVTVFVAFCVVQNIEVAGIHELD